MTEGVLQFIEEYIPVIIGTGFAFGIIFSGVSILLGYVIGKVQGLVVH